jgi:hypothetical protein
VLVHRGGQVLYGNAAARTLLGAQSGDLLTGVSVMSLALETLLMAR